MRSKFLEAGEIVNTHGVRGEVKIMPWADSPEFLCQFDTFYLDGQPLRPTANHVHKSFVLLKLPGVDDMNAALALKGKTLSIRRADAPLKEGEYFDQDLLGLQVYRCENGELLGELVAVDSYPASKVYTVKGEKEYLIPAIPEVFIRSVDLDANRMEVHLLEGMASDEI